MTDETTVDEAGAAGAAALALGSGDGDKGGAGAAETPAGDEADLSWLGDIDDDTRTAIKDNGFKSPVDLARSYVNLRKAFSGGDKLVAPGADEDITKWEGWDKLGALETPEAYSEALKRPEMPDGMVWDAEAEKAFLEIAHKNRWPMHMAQQAIDWGVQERLQGFEKQREAAEADAKDYDTRANSEWGSKRKDEEGLARRAAIFLGMNDDDSLEIGSKFGSFEMISKLAAIGKALGEDGKLVGGGGGSQFGITPEAARAEIKAQNDDPELQKALLHADHPRHKELTDRRRLLQQAAYSGAQ